MRRTVSLLGIALLVVACERPLNGLEKLHGVAASIEAGEISKARTLASDRPDIRPEEILMVDDPAFCQEQNMRRSLDRAAHEAASQLSQRAEEDPVLRYAAAERDLGVMLSHPDESMRLFCNLSDLALYRSVRRPYESEANAIMASLRAKAENYAGTGFERASRDATATLARQDKDGFATNCKAKRAETTSPTGKDPLEARADAYFIQLCKDQGL